MRFISIHFVVVLLGFMMMFLKVTGSKGNKRIPPGCEYCKFTIFIYWIIQIPSVCFKSTRWIFYSLVLL